MQTQKVEYIMVWVFPSMFLSPHACNFKKISQCRSDPAQANNKRRKFNPVFRSTSSRSEKRNEPHSGSQQPLSLTDSQAPSECTHDRNLGNDMTAGSSASHEKQRVNLGSHGNTDLGAMANELLEGLDEAEFDFEL